MSTDVIQIIILLSVFLVGLIMGYLIGNTNVR